MASSPLTLKGVAQGERYTGSLTDVPGIRVGHHTESGRPTGCTVILVDQPSPAGVDVRGSAPGTRETDLLDPVNTVPFVHAVLLSGGSAFGLDAASGVVRFLEERGVGFQTKAARIPIVPAAILYDLNLGDPKIRPNAESGYRACRNASSAKVKEGNLGAGAGATVGKMLGFGRAMKGGLGSASIRIDKLIVAALAAVNCVGDVRDLDSGQVLAGARTESGRELVDLRRYLTTRIPSAEGPTGQNTTLAVVATNASFQKTEMTKVAQMSHDGLARAIYPVHLPTDGDTVFALSAGSVGGYGLAQVGLLAAEVTARAVVRGVLTASGLPGLPAYRDLFPSP